MNMWPSLMQSCLCNHRRHSWSVAQACFALPSHHGIMVLPGFLLLCIIDWSKGRKSIHFQNCKDFLNSIMEYERSICQRQILRCSLISVKWSPWCHVYSSKNVQAMIILTGVDLQSSLYLLCLFCPMFHEYSPFVDDKGYIVKIFTFWMEMPYSFMWLFKVSFSVE